MDMGVENYLVTSSVVAILAQRLVRLICANCRESAGTSLTPFGEEIEIRQGTEIRRPSVLYARAEGSPGRIERVEVAAAKYPFGDTRELKEKHVPTAEHLARIVAERVAHPLQMRTVHHD